MGYGARNLALGLRRRMNALGGRDGEGATEAEDEGGVGEGVMTSDEDVAVAAEGGVVDAIDVLPLAAEVIEQSGLGLLGG